MPFTTKRIFAVVACYNDAGSVMAMYKRLTKALGEVTANYEAYMHRLHGLSSEMLAESARRALRETTGRSR